jgi:hypothetical protein
MKELFSTGGLRRRILTLFGTAAVPAASSRSVSLRGPALWQDSRAETPPEPAGGDARYEFAGQWYEQCQAAREFATKAQTLLNSAGSSSSMIGIYAA